MADPEGWSTEHSVAALLVGMAMIDGEVDAGEMRALVDAMRQLPGFPAQRAAVVAQEVYRHLWQGQEDGGDLIGDLRRHAAELALAYDTDVLGQLHARMSSMADVDGERHPMEQRLLAAFRSSWGLDG